MALNQSLQLKQSQNLVMTQQLQQSIKLLQLSSVDLSEFVNEEIEKNPLLTREETGENDGPAEVKETENSGEQTDVSERDSVDLFSEQPLDQTNDAALDTPRADNWQEGETPEMTHRLSAGSAEKTGPLSSKGDGGGDYNLEQTISSEISLREHLLEQLHVDVTDPMQRIIGTQLIDMLDESGYLRDDTDSLAETLNASQEDIEATIRRLQQFDPPGIFARNLQECIAIQLKDKDTYDPYMQRLVEHIDLMGKGDIAGLQAICEVDDEDFAEMLAEIRLLKPKPASDFIHDVAQTVVPEVFIRRGKGDSWQVELNSDVLPKVLLNQTYYEELNAKSRRKDDKKYISEQMANASWLVKALDQRAKTILKVSSEIVKQQEKFFLHGIQFLKPMTLKDIALSVDMHESTISRVTSNKYMATPRGIFELKYFFTSAISSTVGSSDVSSKTVMHYIRELIDDESPNKILSDDALVRLLKERDIDVARRTVAKYREAMHIPSSVVRRRQKKSQL